MTTIPSKFPLIDKNMSNEEYHRGSWQKQFISSTALKNYLVSPKMFDACRRNPELHEISLSASIQGSVYHSLLASLTNKGDFSDFEREFFTFEPPINEKTGAPYGINTNAYAAALQFAKDSHPGKELTSEAEVATAKKMIEEMLFDNGQTSDFVQRLLKEGEAEVSYFLEKDGVKLKFRPDILTDKYIGDWKTIGSLDLHPQTLINQIKKCGYGISAAFYQYCYWLITGKWLEFIWIFQMKSAPYDAVVVSASEFAYKYNSQTGELLRGSSAIQFEKILAEHIACTKSGIFPGSEVFIEPNSEGERIMHLQDRYNDVHEFYDENAATESTIKLAGLKRA